MIPVPTDIDRIDVAFGNIKHLPKMEDIPSEFKDNNNKYSTLISKWFYSGATKEEMESLKEKEGINRGMALASIRSIMVSFDPKHQRKIAGCAYLLSEWFNIEGESHE